MLERELRPAGPGSEPGTRDGSCCDGMMSTATRSGSSDNSYDFLSAEEKECLLFLEETIGSLDAEADSVLSTDESEPVTTPRGFQALPITQPVPQRNPEITQQEQQPRRVLDSISSDPPEPKGLGHKSGSYSLPRNIHIGKNQNLKKSTTQTNGHFPRGGSEGHLAEPEKGRANRISKLCGTSDSPLGAPLDLKVVLIPPPEAFQDTKPEHSVENSLPKEPEEQSRTPPKRVEISSEAVSHTASGKGTMEGPGQPQPPPAQLSQDAKPEDGPLPSGGDPNLRLAPLTTPKPRKLPPNIVLKSSRSSLNSEPQNWLSRHTEAGDASPASSSLQDQRRARREALEKLGLPQDQEEPSLQLSKPASSIKLKETQGQGLAAAPAPVSAAGKAQVPVRGPSPMKASGMALAQGPSSGKICTPAQEAPPGKVAAPKSAPIPIPKTLKANSPLPQPKPDAGLTLQESSIPGLRQMNFKSNTLERSGVGLSSYLSADKESSSKTSTSLGKGSFLDKISPSILRNSRARPASLGTEKDFANIQVGKVADLEQGQGSKRLSYQGQSHDKLPRPPFVSVKISPKGIPSEHRREALKKLGLLKE
ncbi:specifically androgen-regulated gene protein [Ctenodactylus gundi]